VRELSFAGSRVEPSLRTVLHAIAVRGAYASHHCRPSGLVGHRAPSLCFCTDRVWDVVIVCPRGSAIDAKPSTTVAAGSVCACSSGHLAEPVRADVASV
jgi:hypothetical protein